MTPRLDHQLCIDFPHVFADRSATMDKSCMHWGFECGDGWEPLIREAAYKLEPLIHAEITKDPESWKMGFNRAAQIKEKFGTLRFYLTSGTDEMWDIVAEAERKSAFICEECGAKGKLRGKGWLYTACNKCDKARTK